MSVQRRAILKALFFAWFAQAADAGTLGMGTNEVLQLPSDAIARLEGLRAEPKFQPDATRMYTGVHDAAQRSRAETVINDLIAAIEGGLLKDPTKQFVLARFSAALGALDLSDTEDREQACRYLEAIMDCVGLESSDGLLNTWLYGFDPSAIRTAPSSDAAKEQNRD